VRCLDCNQLFGEYIRKQGSPKSAPAPSSAEPAPPPGPRVGNETLRAKWGLPDPSQPPAPAAPPAQPSQPAAQSAPAAEPEEKSEKVDVSSLVKEELPDLVIAAEQKGIKWLGRQPNDPDEHLRGKLDESMQKYFRGKTPKIEISPGWACLAISAALALQMFIGADPIPQRRLPAAQRPAETRPGANGTGENYEGSSSLPSSSRAPTLSVVQDDGSAKGAGPSVSGD
jgi:hypothetical protein